MYPLVILDFDGTIGDSCPLIVGTMMQTFATLGMKERTADECRATIGLPLREAFLSLMPGHNEEATLCETTYRTLFARNNATYHVPLFPHVAETMALLHDHGITLAVASSRHSQSLHDFLDKMQLSPLVTHVVATNDVARPKPAPDMVLRILALTGFSPQDAIMVGDTLFDINMGKAAGVKTCAVTYGNGKRNELSVADYVIDDFAQLSHIVLSQ